MEAYGHHYNLLYQYEGPVQVQEQYIDYTASDDEEDECAQAYPVAPITFENISYNNTSKIANYGNIGFYGSQLFVPKVTYNSYYQVFKKPVPTKCCCPTPSKFCSSVSAKVGSASALDHHVRGACASVTVCTINGSPPIECVREEIVYEPVRMPSIYKSYRCRRRPRRPKLIAEYVEVLDSSNPKKCWLYRCVSPNDIYDCLNTRTTRRHKRHSSRHRHNRRSVHRKYTEHDFASDFNSSTCASSSGSNMSKCSSSLFSSSNGSSHYYKDKKWLKQQRASELPGFSRDEDIQIERLEKMRDQYSSSITSLHNHNHKAEYLDNDRSLSTSKQEHRRSKASSKGFRLCNEDGELGALRRNR